MRENGWKLLDPNKGERLLTEVPAVSSAPSTSPATTQSTDIAASPLLVDNEGNRYFDGTEALRVLSPDGREQTWPLPPAAVGKNPAKLIKTPDGLLFLFNQPGRVLRIRPTSGEAEPFTLEATFTRRIPSVTKPKRIWLDPAGRICVVDARRFILFFPQGFIPPKIRDLMPVERDAGHSR
jgi:hypothetical protein